MPSHCKRRVEHAKCLALNRVPYPLRFCSLQRVGSSSLRLALDFAFFMLCPLAWTPFNPPRQPFNSQFRSSLSCTQEGCDNPGIAATVEHSHDKEGFFIRGVRNQKIAQGLKTQRLQSQIRTDVALLRKWDEGANRFLDFPKDTVGSTWTVGSDVFPNLG